MLLGALFGGFLPVMCNVSPQAIKWMSQLGGGVLIGSVLQVILPEGALAANFSGRACKKFPCALRRF